MFIIEPMVAKMILPFLGGSPAVWNTSLVFYQACLLAGYAYAHFGSSWLGTRRHALVHLNFAVLAALLLLPVVLPVGWFVARVKASGIRFVRPSGIHWLPILDLVGRRSLDAEMVCPRRAQRCPRSLFLLHRKQCRKHRGPAGLSVASRTAADVEPAKSFVGIWLPRFARFDAVCVLYYLRPLSRKGEKVMARDQAINSIDARPSTLLVASAGFFGPRFHRAFSSE